MLGKLYVSGRFRVTALPIVEMRADRLQGMLI
jgi:hypothetical protein